MKHETVTIKGIDLMDRWQDDNRTAADVAGLDEIDERASYEVSWPDHVLIPRFDGDCEIRLAATSQSVIRLGDGTLLCDKHYAEQYPEATEPVHGWQVGECHLCAK